MQNQPEMMMTCLTCLKDWEEEEMYNKDICLSCAHCESCGMLDKDSYYDGDRKLNLCPKCRNYG